MKIPLYQRSELPPATTGRQISPIDLKSRSHRESASLSQDLFEIDAAYLDREREAKRAVDAVAWENRIRERMDEFATSLNTTTNLDEIDKKYTDMLEVIGKDIDGIGDKYLKAAVEKAYMNNDASVRHLVRMKRAQVVSDQGKAEWVKVKEAYGSSYQTSLSYESRDSIVDALRQRGETLVANNILKPEELEVDILNWTKKNKYDRVVNMIDKDPAKFLSSANQYVDYELEGLDEKTIHDLNRYAVNQRDYMDVVKERRTHQIQEENSEKLADVMAKLMRDEIGYKEFDAILMQTRNPIKVDGVGELRPVKREVFEHYDKLARSYLNGDSKIQANPSVYLDINAAIENGEMTQADLKPFIGVIRPQDIQHFSDRILQMNIASGKVGATKEKRERATLITDLERDEKTYIKSVAENMNLTPDEAWDINLKLEKMVREEVDAQGIGVDRAAFHEKIKTMLEPYSANWFVKRYRELFGSESKNEKKTLGSSGSWGSSPTSPSSSFDEANLRSQQNWIAEHEGEIKQKLNGKPAGVYYVNKQKTIRAEWDGKGGFHIMIGGRK